MKQTLQSYFHASAMKDAGRPALHIAGKYFSYRELAEGSQRVSKFLRGQLRGEGQHCIGILCEKSFSAYAGLLGAMESGNIYVPLNPKLPLNRLEYIAKLAQIKALVVDSGSVAKAAQLPGLLGRELPVFLPENETVPVELQKFAAFAKTYPADGTSDDAGQIGNEAQIAYLLFTSGTTGTPKGVPVTHANAAACIEAVNEHFVFHNTDRFTQFSELSFDVSIADIFLCWKAGACLYVPAFTDLMMPGQFAERHKLTVWSSVPTLANNLRALGGLKPNSLASLRISYFCGEALPAALTREWQAAAAAGIIVNFYGPTEAAIFSTFYVYDKLRPPAEDIVPLGTPLTGFRCRISGEDPAGPDTETGELLLAGPQVVAGYLNNETATRKAFIRLPGDAGGTTWYRTGDRVSRNGQGEFLFHGRCDRQVKIRGYRVELDEIEAVLRRVTDADLVAVIPVYAKDGRCEDIVAFHDSDLEDEEHLKRQCGAHLPVYMLPRRITRLEEFPRSANGKLDYQRLAGFANGTPAAQKPAENLMTNQTIPGVAA
jgi:D-alanine--poly(phosphoribitol) ligase subunit 1